MFDIKSNALKTKTDSGKKDLISGVDGWVRAFSGFMQYRIAINPDLAIPLSKYLDHFCTLADPKRKYSFVQLLKYDKYFWAPATKNFLNQKSWSVNTEDAYLEPPDFGTAGAHQSFGRDEGRSKSPVPQL